MLEGFKVLSAALALDEFTVDEVASRAGVNERTVYSVLRRRRDLFEVASKLGTGRPGGQPIAYRLKQDAALQLKRDLEKLYHLMPRPVRPPASVPDPRALDTVEEYLTRRFRRAASPTRRREILAIAAMNLDSVLGEARQHYGDESTSPEFLELKRRVTDLKARHDTLRGLLDTEIGSTLISSQAPVVEPVVSASSVRSQHTGSHGMPPGRTIVVIDASAGPVASAVGAALKEHAGAHVIDMKVDACLPLEITDITKAVETQAPQGVSGAILIVDSGNLAAAERAAAQFPAIAAAMRSSNVAPVVLDIGYERNFRNSVLMQHCFYAGDAAHLAPDAMISMFPALVRNAPQSVAHMDISGAFGNFAFADFASVFAAQRRNLEALVQANQLAVEGVQAVAQRQIEIAREAVSNLVREWSQPGTSEENIAKNAEFAKQAFEKGVANARELGELVTKANTEAFSVIQKRVAEGLEVLSREYMKTRG